MESITARIAPWSEKEVRSPKTGRVTKAALRAALKANPNGVEFEAVSTPFQRGGYFTLGELTEPARVMVRFNRDMDVAVVETHPSGTVVVK